MDLKLRENQIGLTAAIVLVLFLFANVVVVKMPINGLSVIFDLPFAWYTVWSLLLVIGLLVVVFLSKFPALDSLKEQKSVAALCAKTNLLRLVGLLVGLPFYLFWFIEWNKKVRLTALGVILFLVTLGAIYFAYQLYTQKKSQQ